MKGKIIATIFVTLVITFAVLPVTSKINLKISPADNSDQIQTQFDSYYYLHNWHRYAQGFTPHGTNTVYLTKVYLLLNNFASVQDIRVDIYDHVTMWGGEPLSSATVTAASLPFNEWTWVEFDFPDFKVERLGVHYIVVTHHSVGDMDLVGWACSDGDVYGFGAAMGQAMNPMGDWYQIPDHDFCFKTYGSKSKARFEYGNQLFLRFFEHYSNLFPILQKMLLQRLEI